MAGWPHHLRANAGEASTAEHRVSNNDARGNRHCDRRRSPLDPRARQLSARFRRAFPAHLWGPGLPRLAILVAGLWLFGTGEACIVAAELGNSPWTVLAEGVSLNTPLGIGAATVLISFVVLCAWVPLRQQPGLGTVLNAIIVGVAIGVMLPVLPSSPSGATSWALLACGIGGVAVGGGLYLACRLGPGPRDGLMTGLHARTGHTLRLIRTLIEISALAGGFLLGGTVGIGTVAFALLIGPAVHAVFYAAEPRFARLR
jgi:uncharacterized protein